MSRVLALFSFVVLMASCASPPPAPAGAAADLAPTGRLSAAINFGNPILATKDAATGETRGVSVDLARELGRRLNVPVELVTFASAGQVMEAFKTGTIDVGFVAIDPERAGDVSYTAPYVIIEGAYLVRVDSPVRSNAEVDRAGTRVAVGARSAYDLYLSREIKNATLVRAPTSPEVVDFFIANKLDVAAGVKQQLEADAKRVPELRLLDGRFMVINQAMAMPRGRTAGLDYLTAFVATIKTSGFVGESLKRHGIEGAAVAP